MSSTGRQIVSVLILILLVGACWYVAAKVPELQEGFSDLQARGVAEWNELTSDVEDELDSTYPLEQGEEEENLK